MPPINNFIHQIIIGKNCDGCGYCVEAFECPAIIFDHEKSRADIDPTVCINCGQCLSVCGKGHILKQRVEKV